MLLRQVHTFARGPWVVLPAQAGSIVRPSSIQSHAQRCSESQSLRQRRAVSVKPQGDEQRIDRPVVAQRVDGLCVGLISTGAEEYHQHEQRKDDRGEHPADVQAELERLARVESRRRHVLPSLFRRFGDYSTAWTGLVLVRPPTSMARRCDTDARAQQGTHTYPTRVSVEVRVTSGITRTGLISRFSLNSNHTVPNDSIYNVLIDHIGA